MQLHAPIIDVVLADGAGHIQVTVQTDNRDMVRWDLTRSKKGWPPAQDAPFLWATFMAWAAMHRAGDTADTFEAFEARCLEARAQKAAEEVDPSQPVPGSDY